VAIFVAAAAVGGFETAEHLGWHLVAAYRLFYLLLTRTTAWFAALYTLVGIVIVAARRRTSAASVTQM
jgi:preprotein translocase subunit SecG